MPIEHRRGASLSREPQQRLCFSYGSLTNGDPDTVALAVGVGECHGPVAVAVCDPVVAAHVPTNMSSTFPATAVTFTFVAPVQGCKAINALQKPTEYATPADIFQLNGFQPCRGGLGRRMPFKE